MFYASGCAVCSCSCSAGPLYSLDVLVFVCVDFQHTAGAACVSTRAKQGLSGGMAAPQRGPSATAGMTLILAQSPQRLQHQTTQRLRCSSRGGDGGQRHGKGRRSRGSRHAWTPQQAEDAFQDKRDKVGLEVSDDEEEELGSDGAGVLDVGGDSDEEDDEGDDDEDDEALLDEAIQQGGRMALCELAAGC